MVRFERERRLAGDRRQNRTKLLNKYVFSGYRQSIRRETDRKTDLDADRYDHFLLLSILVIILLCVFDAYFTIIHVEKGAREINPFMNYLIDHGNMYFFSVKYVVTALGLFVLCIYERLFVVRIGMQAILIFYLVVLAHHMFLIFPG